MNLFTLFADRFPTDRSATFLSQRDGRSWSYAELDRLSAQLAYTLHAHGVKAGDRVAVQVEKSAAAVFLYLACLRVGAAFLPLNTAYRADELEYFLTDAAPTLVVGDPMATALGGLTQRYGTRFLALDARGEGALMDHARGQQPLFETVTRDDDDLAAILYSSGTTGRPKGVMLSHGNLSSNALTLHRLWQFKPDDVLLHALPIFHTHGLFVALNTTLMNGSEMIFHERFAVEDVLDDLPRATVFMGVPTYYVRLLASPRLSAETCASVRLFLCGSAPLLDETFHAFERRTGHQIVERYGMTEAGMITSAHLDRPRRPGIVGWPLPDVRLRIVDGDGGDVTPGSTGEIRIQAPNLFRAYWNKPEKTTEDLVDGWFRTGDLARFEPDGSVAIVGRAKDLIISGGFNVYPKEIEEVLDALPGVAESAVVGMPHPDFGEAGLAILTLTSGATPPSQENVISALKTHFANYKVPKLVVIADTLPRNAMGKVQKNLLRETYRAVWAASVGKS